jgi:DNA invertase Pin-like site-specific DNA recombinase
LLRADPRAIPQPPVTSEQKAKERGVRFGPKKKLTPVQIVELQHRRQQGALIKTLMQDYGISKVSVYRYLGTTGSLLSEGDA